MSWLDGLFGKAIMVAGVLLPTQPTLNFVSGATVVDNPAQNRTDVTISGGGSVTWAADLAGSSNSSQVVAALSSASIIPVTTGFSFGTNPASSGSGAYLRFANNTTAIAFRNAANTGDLTGLWCTSGNGLVIGDSGNVATTQLQAATSISTVVGGVTQWTLTSTNMTWGSSLGSVNLLQASTSAANATGATFSISAQAVTGTGTTTSGALSFASGTNTGSTTGNVGNITFSTPAPVGAGTEGQIIFTPNVGQFFIKRNPGVTGATVGTTGQYLYVNATTLINLQQDVRIGAGYTFGFLTTTSPNMWCQGNLGATSMRYGIADNGTASLTGGTAILSGQNATGTTSIGGDAILQPGTGTTRNGSSNVQGSQVDDYLSFTPVNGANNLSIAQSSVSMINCLAGATGAVTITSNMPPTAGRLLFLRNNTSQTITFGWSSGTTITVATNTSALISADGTNAIKLVVGT